MMVALIIKTNPIEYIVNTSMVIHLMIDLTIE
jgi:hypothetical protein